LTRPIGEATTRKPIARRDRLYRLLLAAADIIAASLAVWMCVEGLGEDMLQPITLVAVPFVLLVSKLIGLYDRDELTLEKSTLDEAPALFQLATLYALVFWLLGDVLVKGHLSARQILGFWLALFLALIFGRVLARATAGKLAPPERCVLLGDCGARDQITRKLAGNCRAHVELVAWPAPDDSERAIGSPEEFANYAQALDVHRVIVAPGPGESDELLDAIRVAKAVGLKVSILPRIFEVVGSSVEFDRLEGITVLGVRRFGLSRSSGAIKRAFDLVGATILLVLLAPLALMIVVAIRLDSPGPMLFRQVRVGRDGQSFRMLKFRTMVVGADALKRELSARNQAEGLFKIEDDPRVTRVGRVLRRTSLDELPQLLNVLRGEMSLVGPRPLIVEEDRQVVGWHRRRLQLTPGMTGQWQVLGSARIPLQDMVKIDYLYVANWSLWQDVKILLRTVPYMLARRGQ
jgi:exopolysaccharide biosynthesis polyprenyl glycosylphosphotransferase